MPKIETISRSIASPFAVPNVRGFVAFRVLFGARFYYPVFTIMFLDYGLSLEQFAILNTVWALTIVGLEVPSGALADLFGRRILLLLASSLMVLEMALLCTVPLGRSSVVFVAFLLNRILSGAAEAAASGADEALAFDSLKQAGVHDAWPQVLEVVHRTQAIGFVIAMGVGAAVYDPDLMSHLFQTVGIALNWEQETTMRWPLFLNLVTALLAFAVAFRLTEPPIDSLEQEPAPGRISLAFSQTLRAGSWILHTPFALTVIAAGFAIDGIVRLVVTLSSEYFRVIGYPEASFGLIGAGLATMGIMVPKLARFLVEKRTPVFNLMLLGAVTWLSLVGVSWVVPFTGLVFVILIFASMSFVQFFLSHYLNRIVDSGQRATVLSFRGLALNLAYGGLGLFYSLLVAVLRREREFTSTVGGNHHQEVFVDALAWFPWYFLASFIALLIFGGFHLRRCQECYRCG